MDYTVISTLSDIFNLSNLLKKGINSDELSQYLIKFIPKESILIISEKKYAYESVLNYKQYDTFNEVIDFLTDKLKENEFAEYEFDGIGHFTIYFINGKNDDGGNIVRFIAHLYNVSNENKLRLIKFIEDNNIKVAF